MLERRLSFILISSLLTLFLGGWVLTSALEHTLGQPQQAKDLLHKSGVYTAIIPSQLAETQKANPSLSGLPLDNPGIQKLLESSLDTKKVQTEGDKAVDGIYAWLEGKQDKPAISLSAMPDQQRLATSLGDLAAKHAATLPTCTPEESMSSEIANDPFAAKCLPMGLSAETVRGLVTGEVATHPALSTETIVTEENLTLTNGKTITDTFSAAPVWYQRAEKLPMYLLIAAGVCTFLLLLILGLRQGFWSVGKHLAIVGITLALCAVLVAWVVSYLFKALMPKGISANLGTALSKLTTLFHDAYRNNIIELSLCLVVAGAFLLGLGFILKRLQHAPTKARPQSAPAAAPAVPRMETSDLSNIPSAPAAPVAKSRRKSPPHKKPVRKRKS
jgi:hypothetical protein